jgi:alcohol dehydrogenase
VNTRALVLESPRTLRARELAVPEVGSDAGLLRVEACGLCGTDHEQYTGLLWGGFAFVPGHEVVGVIEAIGDRAAARWGVHEGDRVAVEVFQSCGACPPCTKGEYRHCRRHGLGDMYGFIPVDTPPGLWGVYARHQYLAPDSRLLRVPASLDPVLATVFNPLGAGVRWGVTLPGTAAGDVVAVLGPGIRGQCTVAAVQEAGAGFVLLTGYGERDRARLEVGAAFGADMVVDTQADDPVVALKRATGGLADVVVDVTAKAPAALAQAMALARPGGTVVIAGTRGVADAPGFVPDLIVYKELRILGALGVDTSAYTAALEMLAAGAYPFADLPREVTALDGVEALLQTMAGERDVPAPVHGVVAP